MTGTLTDALLAVHAILESHEISHALCGGLAANLYRDEVRATTDVDLVITVAATAVPTLVAAFEVERFTVEAYWTRGEQLRLSHPGLPRVDCIVATTDFERSAIERAPSADIAGRAIRVLTAEDLIVMKVLAGRARDREAVVAILIARGVDLDVEYIRGWLDQFDALDAWDDVVTLANHEKDAGRG